MQGWIDAIPHIKTKYSMLLHNDGYALDSFFGCELLRGLEAHKLVNSSYALAAPMLYESKAARLDTSPRPPRHLPDTSPTPPRHFLAMLYESKVPRCGRDVNRLWCEG